MNNFKFALRQLLKSPGFALISILTLAFGIGANTAMFSFANALLLRPVPYARPDELVKLNRVTPNNYFGAFAPADFLDLRREESRFGKVAGYHPANLVLAGTERPPDWLRVSANMFDLLGVQPMMGRTFRSEEETQGNHRVALVSYRFWQDHFDSRKDLVGQSIWKL